MSDTNHDIIDQLETEAQQIRKLVDARTAKRPLIIEFSGSPKSGLVFFWTLGVAQHLPSTSIAGAPSGNRRVKQ